LTESASTNPAARIGHESEVPPRQSYSQPPAPPGDLSVRTLIDETIGSRNLLQRTLRIRGHGEFVTPPASEEVLYLVEGSAWLSSDQEGGGNPLWPGTAVLVPPGRGYALSSTGPEQVTVVSILAPPPGSGLQDRGAMARSIGMAHEDQAEAIPAGGDRSFKVLIDPSRGSRLVTQFVGFIERGQAPLHHHDYEEAIYVLGGTGTAHVREESEPVRPGSSIFLPPGTPHCLENTGDEVLKLLGVFSPPGSPAAKRQPG